jgi:membrane protease YdiL (CAAX protease family)
MVDVYNVLTVVVVGLYAGSLLTEAMLLVPYWRTMAAEDFFRLHGEFGPRLFRFFAPLTIAAVVLPLLAAVRGFLAPSGPNFWALAAVGLLLVVLAIFFVYFRAANQRFADRALSNDALKSELTRWSRFHTFRTVLTITAFAASVLAVAS